MIIIPLDGKAATALIAKVSDAMGGILQPWQIKRVARAEAEAEITRAKGSATADIIRAESEARTQEIKRRAMARLDWEEVQQQANMESIIQKSLLEVSEEATPENIEQDWLTYFLKHCRLISNDKMQNFWAKILAGEANSPGAFSKRTIMVVSTLLPVE